MASASTSCSSPPINIDHLNRSADHQRTVMPQYNFSASRSRRRPSSLSVGGGAAKLPTFSFPQAPPSPPEAVPDSEPESRSADAITADDAVPAVAQQGPSSGRGDGDGDDYDRRGSDTSDSMRPAWVGRSEAQVRSQQPLYGQGPGQGEEQGQGQGQGRSQISRRRMPHSSLPAFSFPQAPAPTNADTTDTSAAVSGDGNDDVNGSNALGGDDDVDDVQPLDSQSQSLSQWQWRSQSLSISHGREVGKGQFQGERRRRQPSAPLPAFSFPQAPAPAPAPDADAASYPTSDSADEETTPTSISNTIFSETATTTATTPCLFPTAANCFATAAADVTPPSTSYSTTSSNVSPFTSPPPSRQQQHGHQRRQSRRHSYTPFSSISSPPPPSSSSSSSASRRRHAHRRSAAMSGIDTDAIAALANISSKSSSVSSSLVLGSPVSRPVSIHANIPQIVLNGEPATTPSTATEGDASADIGTEKVSGYSSDPGKLSFPGRPYHIAKCSNLSTISSEGSISSNTGGGNGANAIGSSYDANEVSSPVSATAPMPLISSPTTRRHIRPKTSSFIEMFGDEHETLVSKDFMHRRVQTTTLERSSSGSTQRTVKAGVDGFVETDDEITRERNEGRQQEQEDQERPVSSSNFKGKIAKKQKKDRAWAGILTRKSKKRQVSGNTKKQQQQSQTSSTQQSQEKGQQSSHLAAPNTASGSATYSDFPPPSSVANSEPTLTRSSSISDDTSDFEINFDDDTVVIQTPAYHEEEYDSSASTATTTVSSFESAWKPRSFYEQGRQLNNDENPFSPVIDLDAALGPFRTPEVSDSGSGFSFATKHMHSGRGRRNEFLSPENRHHRRAESAPAIQPMEPARSSPVAMAMKYSAAAIFKTPDVFDEEEEDAFLANTAEKNANDDNEKAEEETAKEGEKKVEEKTEEKDDDAKSVKSFKSYRSRDRSSFRQSGLRLGRGLPPGGRSLRIDTTRASSPFRVQRSESGTSLNESGRPVSPISIGRPLHQVPVAETDNAASNNSEENPDQQSETTPELLSPTPKSQYTSLFSSPSTSSFSINDLPRTSSTFILQEHRSSSGSFSLPPAIKQSPARADSPVDNMTGSRISTPPPSTFDPPYVPSPLSSSTPSLITSHNHHSSLRFTPPTASGSASSSASAVPAPAFHRHSMNGEMMSPSISSPTLRPGSRSRHKRSSIVSLSKLISASHATERNRASMDGRPPGSTSAGLTAPVAVDVASQKSMNSDSSGYKEAKDEVPAVAKSHRISRLMQFWRTRDKDGRGDA
ncbi:hypothetical protein AAP_02524 [Ascosphaera apis ARSEF 7405]|uniref:Cell wall proline rich protein n=1 Tax=Ascosphaera apis ARSEF 7405 TaxID=392613 RepID=A0A167ZT08_9EURO|nr:hypothetical protein AAP_02524 [Ascosphaera apis ARSEF 7405]